MPRTFPEQQNGLDAPLPKKVCSETDTSARNDQDEPMLLDHKDSDSTEIAASHQGRWLIEKLLSDQQQLTAVERFADLHVRGDVPSQAKYYQALLPASPPSEGQQYAFDVDLDRCSGCKACVAACHTMNGLSEGEAWRSVGLMFGGTTAEPTVQHVTTACHHCLEPACATACPVNAYEKDPVTGIVKHLDDQCFGCQYCTLACPYDVPQFLPEKGIVRKCDMCSTRLAVGEAPACVQSCPHEAIRIQVVDAKAVIEDAEATTFLPAAPDAQVTLPTTTFRTSRVLPRNLLPADYYDVAPRHPHWPLVIMLVLTQLSVGAFLAGLVLESALPEGLWQNVVRIHAFSSLFFGLFALIASTCHLGRPHLAYRAILGIGHSWLSREIVCFGAFAGCAVVYSLAVAMGDRLVLPPGAVTCLAWGVASTGVAGVFCSAMIYIVTHRETWGPLQTGVRFGLTTALLGVAAVWLCLLLAVWLRPAGEARDLLDWAGPVSARWVMAMALAKLAWDALIFRHLLSRRMTGLKRSAILMTHELSNITLARFAVGALGGLIMPGLLLQQSEIAGSEFTAATAICAGGLIVACIVGELLERYLFFAAAAAARMPGGIR